MPNFRYSALTQTGDLVSGVISASTATEVTYRIDYLHLVPITVTQDARNFSLRKLNFHFGQRARVEDVTAFTTDLALLLRAGSRLDAALELLAGDADVGRLRPVVATLRSNVISGESFADALSRHPTLFSSLYVALVRVGETSGTLEHTLDSLASERTRMESLRRKLGDALKYPIFLLCAAACVLVFFLMFVMPQFDAVLHDFNVQLDPVVRFFLALSNSMSLHKAVIGFVTAFLLSIILFTIHQRPVRVAIVSALLRVPVLRPILGYHLTALFCRNLSILLSSAVPLASSLQILADMMAAVSSAAMWNRPVNLVRHGGKLADGLADVEVLPPMAVRMLRLGEETGQLALLAGRVADFYEKKLQRSLDRVTGIVGPAAILVISTLVGGLIASVMTSLLSISQVIG